MFRPIVIARGAADEAIQSEFATLDCFAEFIIGPRIRADPLARNDDRAIRHYASPIAQTGRTSTEP